MQSIGIASLFIVIQYQLCFKLFTCPKWQIVIHKELRLFYEIFLIFEWVYT